MGGLFYCWRMLSYISHFTGGSAGDPNMCEPDFGKIASCMADGRDHVPCCQAAAVPEVCQVKRNMILE